MRPEDDFLRFVQVMRSKELSDSYLVAISYPVATWWRAIPLACCGTATSAREALRYPIAIQYLLVIWSLSS